MSETRIRNEITGEKTIIGKDPAKRIMEKERGGGFEQYRSGERFLECNHLFF